MNFLLILALNNILFFIYSLSLFYVYSSSSLYAVSFYFIYTLSLLYIYTLYCDGAGARYLAKGLLKTWYVYIDVALPPSLAPYFDIFVIVSML